MAIDLATMKLKDGRRLAWSEHGDPKGHPWIHAHGGPGSRIEGRLFDAMARARGIRFLVLDRPGYGRSDFKPGRTLLDYAADVAEFADALGIDRFGNSGWSGGGAHALAVAKALPGRADFTFSLAGYTLLDFEDAHEHLPRVDAWAAHFSQTNPLVYRSFFVLTRAMIRWLPKMTYKQLRDNLSEADQAILDDPTYREIFLAELTEAVRPGSIGVTRDAAIEYNDWGFKPEEIVAHVHVFQGTADEEVPELFGRDLAERLPNNTLHILEGQGHFFPATHQTMLFDLAGEILASTD